VIKTEFALNREFASFEEFELLWLDYANALSSVSVKRIRVIFIVEAQCGYLRLLQAYRIAAGRATDRKGKRFLCKT
jgi:hypothetical protein